MVGKYRLRSVADSSSGSLPGFQSSLQEYTDFYQYYQLEDTTLFLTGVDMCSDVLGLIFTLGFLNPLFIHQIFGAQANKDNYMLVLYIYLILSFLVNLGVILSKHYNKSIFSFSLTKGILLLIPFGMILGNLPTDNNDKNLMDHDMDTENHHHQRQEMIPFYDPSWPLAASFFAVLFGIKGLTLKAHFSFHSYSVRSAHSEHLAMLLPRQCPRHQGQGQGSGGQSGQPGQDQGLRPHPRQRNDVENPLEDFYIRKTALLNHNLLMKETTAQLYNNQGITTTTAALTKDKADDWTENYYIKSGETDGEKDKINDKKKQKGRKDKVWILSDPGRDKFLTREVAFPLEGGKYVIYDGQISL